jgi:hypothetical protein
MKIDNILNKEKSPDKATIAERATSIEDLKKSQKFYEFNDLSNATNINNNLLQEQEAIYDFLPPTTSKLKKLLLNSDADPSSLINDLHQNSGFLTNSVVNSNSASTKNNLVKANETNALTVPVNNKRNNHSVTKKATRNANKKKLFLCSECNEHFLKLHLFNHIKSVHNKFTCLYCYGFFVDAAALEKHLVKKHKVQNTAFFDEVSLQNYLCPKTAAKASKVVKAVCCKCGSIFNITDNNFVTHSCGDEDKVVEVPKNIHQNQNHIENSHQAVHNDLSCGETTMAVVAPPMRPLDPAKEDFYCDQAIQQWCQPPSFNTLDPHDQLSGVNTDHQPLVNETSSQNANDTWQNEQNQNRPIEEKLVVPKLMLKIPKGFQNQTFNNVESEDESDDEGSSDEDNERQSNKSESFTQNLSKSNDREGCSSSLSDTDNEANDSVVETPKKPENFPSLKLKIKNLASNNPESVLENFDFPPPSEDTKDFNDSTVQNDVDMTECPMDLEPTKEPEEPEPEPEKLIIIDGVVVTPADEDVMTLEISLKEGLDKIPIVKFMKICLTASFPFCLYCNHARKIVVNGRALASHFITHHRFHAMVDSITAEELHPEKIVSKFESSIIKMRRRRKVTSRFHTTSFTSAFSVAFKRRYTKSSIYTTGRCTRSRLSTVSCAR